MRSPSLMVCLAGLVSLAVQAAEPGHLGTITGTVRLTGKPPILAPRLATNDLEVCGEEARPSLALLLGPNQTIGNAIVYLAVVTGNQATNNLPPATLEALDCELTPRIQIARSGAALILRNRDPVLHIVHLDTLSATNGTRQLITVPMPYAGFEKQYVFGQPKEPTLLKVAGVNGHEWMTAYIALIPNPWAAITDESGKFQIGPLPAGTYKLHVWHEVLGTFAREVKVVAGQPTRLDLEFVRPASSQPTD